MERGEIASRREEGNWRMFFGGNLWALHLESATDQKFARVDGQPVF